MPPCRLTGNFPNRTSTEIPVLIQFEGNDWLDVGGNLAACIRWPKIVIEVHLDWDTNQVGYRVRQFLREQRSSPGARQFACSYNYFFLPIGSKENFCPPIEASYINPPLA